MSAYQDLMVKDNHSYFLAISGRVSVGFWIYFVTPVLKSTATTCIVTYVSKSTAIANDSFFI